MLNFLKKYGRLVLVLVYAVIVTALSFYPYTYIMLFTGRFPLWSVIKIHLASIIILLLFVLFWNKRNKAGIIHIVLFLASLGWLIRDIIFVLVSFASWRRLIYAVTALRCQIASYVVEAAVLLYIAITCLVIIYKRGPKKTDSIYE